MLASSSHSFVPGPEFVIVMRAAVWLLHHVSSSDCHSHLQQCCKVVWGRIASWLHGEAVTDLPRSIKCNLTIQQRGSTKITLRFCGIMESDLDDVKQLKQLFHSMRTTVFVCAGGESMPRAPLHSCYAEGSLTLDCLACHYLNVLQFIQGNIYLLNFQLFRWFGRMQCTVL